MDRMELLNTYLNAIGEPTFVFFGPRANCTLELCPATWSVYAYQPSLAANLSFLTIFFALLVAHVAIGVKYRAYSFMACMVAGCFDEMLGYAGRVWMYFDLWNFNAFMLQVVCITTAPVFYCAAIYVVLAKSIATFAPALSRFKPDYLYWVFIPCDLASLVLQAIGGALSAVTSGVSLKGVNIALAGLALQVATLVIFCAIYLEYIVRYYRSGLGRQQAQATRTETSGWLGRMSFGTRLTLFYAFEVLSIVMILARCAFRVEELRDGYGGPLVKKQGLFIGLEGVPIVIAASALCIGHPGLIFNAAQMRKSSAATASTAEFRLDK